MNIGCLKVAFVLTPGLIGLLFGWQELGAAAEPFTVGFVLIFSYAISLTLGRTVLVALLRRGWSVLLAAVVAGGMSAALPFTVITQIFGALGAGGFSHWWREMGNSFAIPLMAGAYGLVGGVIFWCVFELARIISRWSSDR
jgi:hypothetical protein